MTAKEVAEYSRRCYQTVLRAWRAGDLPGAQAKPNGKVDFHRDDVDRWKTGETQTVKRGKKQPVKRRGPRRLHKVG